VLVPPKVLEGNLHDKFYYSLGGEKWEYLAANASKIAIDPHYPPDLEVLVQESAKSDLKNQVLLDNIKEEGLAGIRAKWKESQKEALRARLGDVRIPRLEEELNEDLQKLIKMETDQYLQYTHPWDENSPRLRNSMLLMQQHVSSALSIDQSDLSYFVLKVQNFDMKNAQRYVSGWEGIIPLVKRKTI
jgi:hypothetical protein